MIEALPLFGALPHWAMDRNLVLQAGAGTGKTHALVTLALHLLSGANARGRPVAPARLVALTFTEKAGAEMRERLLQRMTPLAEGAAIEEREPELARTFGILGRRPPDAAFWARARRDLALATVGTFHSFCATQLRRLAPLAGLDPAFTVLDDSDARLLFDEASEAAVLEALVVGTASIRLLVDEFGLSDDKPKGLIRLASDVLSRLSEDGLDPAGLDDGRFDDARAVERFESACESLRRAAGSLDTHKSLVEPREAFLAALSSVTPDQAEPLLDRLTAIRKSFRKPRGDAGLSVESLDEAIEAFAVATAGLRAAPLGRAFVALLTEIDGRYRSAKEAQDALDFSDLQRTLRDLLARSPEARRALKDRIDALLVDEFQDTSRLQLDLVALLAESRAGEASVDGAGAAEAVTFEPGLLCVVGDRKQSIYEFRGADVAVFSGLVEAATGPRSGGAPARIEQLTRSWRSRPALVHFVNALFRQAMPAATEPFEVAFTDGDALDPQLREPESGPLVELVTSQGARSEEQRKDEAERIAARIDELLRVPERSLQVRDRGHWRPVEGRDIALLFRRLTNLDLYRSALSRRGLAHVVVGGGGFYEALEVSDAWALLRMLDAPDDALACAAVLRSSFCLLSDASLVELITAPDGPRRLDLGTLLRHPVELERADEQARLEALLAFARRMAPELDRLGCVEVLPLAVDELNYLAVASALTDADQIAANLVQLQRVLDDLERRSTTAGGAIRELGDRIRSGRRAAGASASEESDPRSIRLMSIHQSKGLEFPVVFVCDCGATETADTDAIAYDRDLGLALSVRTESGKRLAGPNLAEVRARRSARAAAESLRLLYVAATRAKDHLFFSGAPRKGSWMERLAALGPEHVRASTVDLSLAPQLEPSQPERRVRAAPPERPPRLKLREATATVTRLQDFDLCPERHRLRHELGLDEHPPALVVQIDGDTDELDASLDALTRGTLSHRLLERYDFADLPASERRARLDTLILAEGHSPEQPDVASLRADVEAFLESPLAARLATDARRLRELPFFLRFDVGDGRQVALKGQIDLVTVGADGIRVVDYKQARADAHGDDQYDFQLACYALAARELTGGAPLPIETSVVFLADRGAARRKPLTQASLAAFETRLRALGRALLDAHETNTWQRRERPVCDRIRCGYRSRCFPPG